MVEQEGKCYLGNMKRSDAGEKPISDRDLSNIPDLNAVDDLPF
jgi:hypothetical protein